MLVQTVVYDDDVSCGVVGLDDCSKKVLKITDCFWVCVSVAVYYEGGGTCLSEVVQGAAGHLLSERDEGEAGAKEQESEQDIAGG